MNNLIVGHIYECFNESANLWEIRYFSEYNKKNEAVFVCFYKHIKNKDFGAVFSEYKHVGPSNLL